MDTSRVGESGPRELRQGSEVFGRFHLYAAEPPSAELFEAVTDLPRVVDVVVDELAGWNLTTTDETMAMALVGRGASLTRHFSLMSVDLTSGAHVHTDPAAIPTFDVALDVRSLASTDDLPDGVVRLIRSAYPQGHVDEELGDDDAIVRDIRRAQSGSRLGPLMDGSAFVFDHDRPVGMVLVNRVPGEPPLGGPWVTDVCRDPDPVYSGLGRTMMTRVLRLCDEKGEPAVSLAVTEGNPARRLYESLGFDVVATTWRLRIPQ